MLEKVAIMYIKAHQKVSLELEKGNELADREAKETARGERTVEGALIPDGWISPKGGQKLSPQGQLKLKRVQKGISSQTGEETRTTYMVALSEQLRNTEKHVAGTQSRGLDGPVHDIQPGDYVYVKSHAEKTLKPQWERPFQVLHITFTMIKVEEQSTWIHHTQVKKAPETPWKATLGDNELKLKITRAK
ncbi:hypothetical protein DUI87_25726 [Hirundo rustica rustica]|uniref:Murine leukemia virus integrase C-terminal domain-containing protein n=1 Tax=Hirundo rustica rustica TaxID=333673 RepID=A0A3M0J974_HIRRU|nr:hypothetical protein DUI87_25726 [Hirundo rustica rustica]